MEGLFFILSPNFFHIHLTSSTFLTRSSCYNSDISVRLWRLTNTWWIYLRWIVIRMYVWCDTFEGNSASSFQFCIQKSTTIDVPHRLNIRNKNISFEYTVTVVTWYYVLSSVVWHLENLYFFSIQVYKMFIISSHLSMGRMSILTHKYFFFHFIASCRWHSITHSVNCQ